MKKFEKVFETLELTGTNWTAEKLPLQTSDGRLTGSFGMFRSDSKAWLGTVKERYEPFQNSNLLELLIDATDSLDLSVTNGGTLKNGSKIYYQIALPAEFIGKSSIKRNISAINSHDGSTAISFGSCNTVVVCQNTFYKAHKEMEKVKHTASANDRVIMMANNLKNTINADLLLMDNFKRMADIQLRDEIVENLVKKLFKVKDSDNLDSISTRSKNQISTFANNLETEINLEGKSIWGLFNAVTRYTNHEAAPKDIEKKNDYLMTGTGLTLSNLAYEELMTWVSKESAEYVLINR